MYFLTLNGFVFLQFPFEFEGFFLAIITRPLNRFFDLIVILSIDDSGTFGRKVMPLLMRKKRENLSVSASKVCSLKEAVNH